MKFKNRNYKCEKNSNSTFSYTFSNLKENTNKDQGLFSTVLSNKDNESIDEIYKEKVDTIKKLEYNCKVWNNRKLKTQGLRMCENCGNTLPYDSSFCNKCGYKLQAVSEELVII